MRWFLIGYPVLVMTVAAVFLANHFFELSKSDWASWVQAVGSIATIIGAFVIGERQALATHQNDLKLKKAEVQRKNGSILAICDAALVQASKMAAIYRDKSPNILILHLTYDEKFMKDTINALEAIPVHECGSFDAVSSFMLIKNSFI